MTNRAIIWETGIKITKIKKNWQIENKKCEILSGFYRENWGRGKSFRVREYDGSLVFYYWL